MALKLKLDKDTVLEFLETRKDVLFVALLVVLLLFGGWSLYQKSALSVGDIIDDVIKKNADRPGGAVTANTVLPEDVVNSLLDKRSQAMYNIQRNPFGSPEEQLRIRTEVQQTYNRAVDLFNAGDYETAIQQFERVIALDVTETRISYPIMPSEYKRRAQREFLKGNFQGMLTSAENDISEGARFAGANQLKQAEQVYARANKTLSDAIAADPDGSAIGKENLDKIQKMQQDVFGKWQVVQTSMLKTEISKGLSQSQQVLAQGDQIAVLKSLIQLQKVQEQLTVIDPNFALVKTEERQPVVTLITNMQNRLKDNYDDLIAQAEAQFNNALASRDIAKTKESIQAMRLAANFNQQDKALPQKIAALVSKRAQLVIELATEFIAQQKAILDAKNYDRFNADGKVRFLDELVALRAIGGSVIGADQKKQIAALENTLRTEIRKPPELTEGYDILSIKKGSFGNKWTVSVRDKTSRTGSRPHTLSLAPGGSPDSTTKISLVQVDTDEGFVILSKPGYSNTKVTINQNN